MQVNGLTNIGSFKKISASRTKNNLLGHSRPGNSLKSYPIGRIMEKRVLCLILALLFVFIPGAHQQSSTDDFWGFYGHKLINRLAVFTLPIKMIPYFKSNIDYIEAHSVDPDKRRYVVKSEAVRHYIDIDHWDSYPFSQVPRTLDSAMVKYGAIAFIDTKSRDTVKVLEDAELANFIESNDLLPRLYDSINRHYGAMLSDGFLNITALVKEDSLLTPVEGDRVILIDRFSAYGILPYHLLAYHKRLVRAFRTFDHVLIVRLSTEIGHYISDAHVPLHTTLNYDGQLTGQDGLHAFWESRIPELFAESEYDLFVGKAEYIEDVESFYWDIVHESHQLVDEVLSIERSLRDTFPRDRQYCFDERNGITMRLECKDYAKAYQEAMRGMVETQIRKSIKAVGSIWMTAWHDAFQPKLSPDVNFSAILAPSERDTTYILPDEAQSVQDQNNKK